MGWSASAIAVAVIIVGWMSGAFGAWVERRTEPMVKEVVVEEIIIHELRMEPRLQAIEHSTSESVDVQKAILEELKKGNE